MKLPVILITSLFASIFLFTSCCKDDDLGDPGDCICYEIYAPVCGDDGVVYDNDCYAECAGVEYTPGYCPETGEGKIIDTGPIALDGCGWLIEIPIQDAVIVYSPTNLDAQFQVTDLEVTLTYKRLLTFKTCGLGAEQYPEIEILEMEIK